MGADNWRVCPRCSQRRSQKIKEFAQRLDDEYGTISLDEFRGLQKEQQQPSLERNLREDYEVRIDEFGHFSIWYGCSCSKCGFAFSFKHKESVKIDS